MAEIILVFPKFYNWDYERDIPTSETIPMGLLSIGSMLANSGFRIKIIDGNIDRNYLDSIKEEIKNQEVLFLGISVMTTQIKTAFEVARISRSQRPDLRLVWGGIHPTLFPEQTCQHPLVDIVVVGEGEHTCLTLARQLKTKANLSQIKGICYKKSNEIINTGPGQILDFEQLPVPNYDLINMEKYANWKLKGINKRALAIHTGIGCPHRCTFCINTMLYHYKRRAKSAVRILEEIKFLCNKYKVNHISFRDENFFASPKVVLRFLEETLKSNLSFTWDTTIRADYFRDNYLTSEIMKKVKAAGCIRLGIGVESGAPRILGYLCKDIDLADVENTARLCKEYDISPYYSFMIGLPGETQEEMLATVNFISRLKKINPAADIITPQIYRPYPGNELYQKCKEAGFHEPDGLDEWATLNLEISGYALGKDIPWVKNPRFIYSINFFVEYAIKTKVPWDWRMFFYVAVKSSFWLRSKLDFWWFLFERPLYEYLRKIKNRIMKNKIDQVEIIGRT